MMPPSHSPDDAAALSALANGIIPPDTIDAGAGMVFAGEFLAARCKNGVHTALYTAGLRTARAIAQERFGRAVLELDPLEIHELLGILLDHSPGFFKQLRMDVCGVYMSDPRVWKTIGFPGPSTDTGGYPDFDQPQT